MEQCGVTEVARLRIGTLSKGFRQRVGLAQVLVGDPTVLLLDEPTAGLDPEQVAAIRALVRSLARTRAVLLSSHVLAEVELTCHRVVIMSKGRLVAEDSPDGLAARFRSLATVVLEVEGPLEAITRAVESVRGVRAIHRLQGATGQATRFRVETDEATDLRRELVQAVVGAGLTLVEIHGEPVSLEDAFLTLVGRPSDRR
jgi:ABC-2 type transport system ATP-binding protein